MSINFSATDLVKQKQLKRMKSLALWLLIAMAVVFAVSFSFQDRFPAFGFVRAASEGGMVGAIADWFAVTALFRHPLGLKIPHTNLIARKKDDIGQSLGDFIEENFLADTVIHEKLTELEIARTTGDWLSAPENAARVSNFFAGAGQAFLTVIDDEDVRILLEQLLERHVIGAPWNDALSTVLSQLLVEKQEDSAIDMLADHLTTWLRGNPESFDRLVSGRLPSWMPGFANRFVDKKAHAEAIKFVESVRLQPAHPLRKAVSKMLHDVARDLSHDEAFILGVEVLKKQIFSSKRVRTIVSSVWSSARDTLFVQLQDQESELIVRLTSAVQDLGRKLSDDAALQDKVDAWVMKAAEHLVQTYRHDIASIVSDTVERWNPAEATRKIELQVGKDLQYIRINGTIVGALAGLTIYSVAILVKTLFV